MLIKNKVPILYILKKVKFEIVYVLVIGSIAHYLGLIFKNEIPVMPIAIPAFIGTAISVLLSFKLNQSYDRWWEARKIWGSIVNDSRSFILQLQAFLPKNQNKEIKTIAFRHIAWCYSLGQSLRNLDSLENLQHYFSDNEIKKIQTHKNIPLAIIQLNNEHIAEFKLNNKIDTFSQIQLINTLGNFVIAMGKAERIKNTVFPVSYRIFLHFLIYIFVVTLSISLREVESMFELPLLLVLSLSFFLLQKSATHLEDPFMNRPTDTPMTAIATTIEINLKQLINEKELPEPLTVESYFIV